MSKFLSFTMAALALAASMSARADPVDDYRLAFAREVYAGSSQWVHDRQPQPLLRAVVVLRIKPTEAGYDVEVFRENAVQPEMTARALETVRRVKAMPLPAGAEDLKSLGFLEVWLFDNDGSFQVKTLAKPQRSQ